MKPPAAGGAAGAGDDGIKGGGSLAGGVSSFPSVSKSFVNPPCAGGAEAGLGALANGFGFEAAGGEN